MATRRVLAVPFLILAVLPVSACGSSSTTTAAGAGAAGATATHTMSMTSTVGMPMTTTSAQGMQMSSMQPENDAAALAALRAHDTKAATRDLRAALGSRNESVAAKRYARQALLLVGQHKTLPAEMPGMQGAAVEHLTYALAALNARDPKTATGHLMEASMLAPAFRAAAAALAAIKAHNIARAASVVRGALHGLGA
jgi:hypothetical protein